MTGPRDPRDGPPVHPDDDSSWPTRDLEEREAGGEADVAGSEVRGTDAGRSGGPPDDPSPDGSPRDEADRPEEVTPDAAAAGEVVEAPPGSRPEIWDTRRFGDRRRPTTAEQAVPWLVGLVLALAGIVIVLLALIYTDANGGFGALSSPSPSAVPFVSPTTAATPSPTAVQSATPSASVTPAPTPAPTYGALEMEYLIRPGGTRVAELLRNDFASSASASVVERASSDVLHYAVAPDGTVAAAIVNGRLLALEAGKPARSLASGVVAVTFASDASTVYTVKIARAGTNDTATLLSIAFATGKASTLATISMTHPAAVSRSRLDAARFFDEGGADRLYATSDGNLVLWVSGAGQWRVDPADGSTLPVTRQPVLWSPDGTQRIAVTQSGTTTTLALVDNSGATLARTQVTGLISHLRWSPNGRQVAFTAGLEFSGGGVRQDLWTWDLVNGRKPRQLTSNGATWGAEWLGVAQFWQP